MKQDIPQFYTGNFNNGFVNAADLLPLPNHTSFGNLSLKYLKIFQGLIYLNQKLNFIFSEHLTIKNNFVPVSYLYGLDEIVFILRRIIDELISLLWLMDNWVIQKECPKKLTIDCIGGVLAKNNQNFQLKYFNNHIQFLTDFNHISNAQKHSFIQSEINLIGDDEPVINALRLDRNDLNKIDMNDIEGNFYSIYLRDLVINFNKLFSDLRISLESLNKQIMNFK